MLETVQTAAAAKSPVGVGVVTHGLTSAESKFVPVKVMKVPLTPEVAESMIVGPAVTLSIAVAECVPSASLYVIGSIPGVTDARILK